MTPFISLSKPKSFEFLIILFACSVCSYETLAGQVESKAKKSINSVEKHALEEVKDQRPAAPLNQYSCMLSPGITIRGNYQQKSNAHTGFYRTLFN